MIDNRLKGTLFIILSTLAYAMLPVLSQLAFKEGLNVSSLLFFRFFIACVITWPYILLRNIPYKTSKSHLFYLMTLAILGFLGTSSFLYIAYTYISGSLATILLFTHPAMIACYEMFILKTGKDLRKIFALCCATIGIILSVWNKNMQLNPMGIILSLLSAVCYSFYALGLAEKRTKKMNSISITGYILFFCSLTYFVQGMINHNIFIPISSRGWIYIVLQSTFSTVFATIFFCKGVQLIGPGMATIISTFEPVVACIAGFFIIGDILTPPVIIGGIFILSAIFILQIPERIIKNL